MSIARWNLKEAVAKHWPDEQEVDTRQGTWTSGPENAKSETCTETFTDTIRVLNPKLRGWCNYFQYAACKGIMEELDGWIRSRLRCIIWRQWKKPKRRRLELIKRGINPENAKLSASNGFGPWWNAEASHMKQAFPKKFFDALELYSLLDATMKRSISS